MNNIEESFYMGPRSKLIIFPDEGSSELPCMQCRDGVYITFPDLAKLSLGVICNDCCSEITGLSLFELIQGNKERTTDILKKRFGL